MGSRLVFPEEENGPPTLSVKPQVGSDFKQSLTPTRKGVGNPSNLSGPQYPQSEKYMWCWCSSIRTTSSLIGSRSNWLWHSKQHFYLMGLATLALVSNSSISLVSKDFSTHYSLCRRLVICEQVVVTFLLWCSLALLIGFVGSVNSNGCKL